MIDCWNQEFFLLFRGVCPSIAVLDLVHYLYSLPNLSQGDFSVPQTKTDYMFPWSLRFENFAVYSRKILILGDLENRRHRFPSTHPNKMDCSSLLVDVPLYVILLRVGQNFTKNMHRNSYKF